MRRSDKTERRLSRHRFSHKTNLRRANPAFGFIWPLADPKEWSDFQGFYLIRHYFFQKDMSMFDFDYSSKFSVCLELLYWWFHQERSKTRPANQPAHTVSFDQFLSGLEWILNLEFSLLKLLIFYQKLLWNIRSRLNSSTFWVFKPGKASKVLVSKPPNRTAINQN